jgi:hypothetical protein
MRIVSGNPEFVFNQLLTDIKNAKLSIKVTFEEFMILCDRSGSIWLMGVKYEPITINHV